MTILLDGKALSLQIQEEIAARVRENFSEGQGPRLAVILVGNDPGSASYVRIKKKTAERLGYRFELRHFPEDARAEEIEAAIDAYNVDPDCDALFVQLPLPRHLDPIAIANRVDIRKDADGLTRASMGALALGELGHFQACTPRGIVRLLDAYGIEIAGKNAVIVGRSNIVGKPTGLLLLARHATVSFCHRQTRDLEAEVRRADILIVAAGAPKLIQGHWIKEGAVVIDAGFSKMPDGQILGDVDFETAQTRASHITPVPGGVGPMTVAMLMEQTLESALKRRG